MSITTRFPAWFIRSRKLVRLAKPRSNSRPRRPSTAREFSPCLPTAARALWRKPKGKSKSLPTRKPTASWASTSSRPMRATSSTRLRSPSTSAPAARTWPVPATRIQRSVRLCAKQHWQWTTEPSISDLVLVLVVVLGPLPGMNRGRGRARARLRDLMTPTPRFKLLEEIIPFVIHQDKRREIHYLNFPNSFHAQFGILQKLDVLDIVLRQDGGGSADAAEIEAAVFFAGVRNHLAAVSLRNHDHAAAIRLEPVNVGIHAPGRRRT